jgi:hypothetical protein
MIDRAGREAFDPRVVSTDVRAAALAYAAHGWSVIPIEPRGKRPLVGWREFQYRRADPAQIDAWFARWPDANVGIVTGRVSGLVVIDVDAQHGGLESLQALKASQQLTVPTVEAVTGGGGRHFYLAHPRRPLSNRVALLPGIDLRADGGCRRAIRAGAAMHGSALARRARWSLLRCPRRSASRHTAPSGRAIRLRTGAH